MVSASRRDLPEARNGLLPLPRALPAEGTGTGPLRADGQRGSRCHLLPGASSRPQREGLPPLPGERLQAHGIYEVLRIQEDMATAISKGASTDVIRQLALNREW